MIVFDFEACAGLPFQVSCWPGPTRVSSSQSHRGQRLNNNKWAESDFLWTFSQIHGPSDPTWFFLPQERKNPAATTFNYGKYSWNILIKQSPLWKPFWINFRLRNLSGSWLYYCNPIFKSGFSWFHGYPTSQMNVKQEFWSRKFSSVSKTSSERNILKFRHATSICCAIFLD